MKIDEAVKQRKFKSSQEKVFINIIYTFNWMNSRLTGVFKKFDITQQQYNVLRILKGKYPQDISCGAVKEVMLDKSPDLTRLCDRLIAKGHIERAPNMDNRREVILKITKKGIELLATMSPDLEKDAELYTKNLSAEEAERLSELLDKMRG